MSIIENLTLCCSCLLLTAACSNASTKGTSSPVVADAGGGDDGGATETCDKAKRPILFVHGIMGGGDNFELQAQRFTSNGYCRSALRAFDYDATYLAFGSPPQSDVDANQVALDAAVDAYLADSGADQLDLVGHSFGTATSHLYLSVPAHAAKIAHYAQAAGGGLTEPVPQVNLSSDGDFVAGHPKKVAAAPAENADIGYIDHVGVLTCKESFAAMYQLFNGKPPATTDVLPESRIEVSGFFSNFSDNTPHPNAPLKIYELDPATGERLHTDADFEFVTGSDGSWGPFVAKPDGRYEFLEPEAGEAKTEGAPARPQHTYRGPFARSTHLMHLKALPKAGSFANGIIAGHVQYSDETSGLILQNNNRAMVSPADPASTHGKDSLTVNGSEFLTAEVAPESLQLIALFAFDNAQAPLSKVTTISSPFFLSGIDISLPTSDPSPVEIVYNGFKVHVHRWKSDTEGSTLVLLDN
jgi:pimeloyl-ACP methyl ester carboxylesterase